jgi:glutamate-1-semialdehyde 2,1-aminomutase
MFISKHNNQRKTTRSEKHFTDAKEVIASGVNSPVRAFIDVGPHPRFIKKGKGSLIVDEDDNAYTDYCLSWGSLIFGHAHRRIVDAVKKTVGSGTSFGCPTVLETRLARLIRSAYPSMEKVRFVNSGTEAAMSAVRLARAFTGRDKVVKLDGCYHGHADHLLVRAGSGAGLLAQASSAGVPQAFAGETISLPFNDIDAMKNCLAAHGREIACVIVEPVPANMGLIIPIEGYLETIRRLTKEQDALLIFDEVITGFRLARGGAAEAFGISPDIACLGKIIGGGFPVGAFGARAEIMDLLAPTGSVYQAGTLSGNPVAMTAGIATLSMLGEGDIYVKLADLSEHLREGLRDPRFSVMGSMFCYRAGSAKPASEIRNLSDALETDKTEFASFHAHMLEKGIYLSPSRLETNFFSTAHTHNDVENLIRSIKDK